MRAALAQYEIVGVRTNVEFLGRLMSAPAFVDAHARYRADRARARAPVSRRAGEATAVECGSWRRSAVLAVAERREWRCRAAAGADHAVGRPRRLGARASRGERRWKLREGEVEREVAALCPMARRRLRHVRVSATRSICSTAGEHRVFEWIDPYLPASSTPTRTAACAPHARTRARHAREGGRRGRARARRSSCSKP